MYCLYCETTHTHTFMVSAYKQAVTPWGMDSIRGKIHGDMLCQNSESKEHTCATPQAHTWKHTTTVLCERQHNQTHQHQVFCSLGFFDAFLLSYTCKHSVHAPPFPSLVKFFLTSGEKTPICKRCVFPCLATSLSWLCALIISRRNQFMYIWTLHLCVYVSRNKLEKFKKRAKFVAKEREEKVSTLLIKFFPPVISFMRVGKWILSRMR